MDCYFFYVKNYTRVNRIFITEYFLLLNNLTKIFYAFVLVVKLFIVISHTIYDFKSFYFDTNC